MLMDIQENFVLTVVKGNFGLVSDVF